MFIKKDEDFLEHFGVLRKSGRYPWGSGDTVHARSRSFLDNVDHLKSQGLSESDVAKGLGLTTTELRAAKTISKNALKQADISRATQLKDKGHSNSAIGRAMGINESSVRSLLAPGQKDKADSLEVVASMLKTQVDTRGPIDIGSGVENHIGISDTKLKTAVAMLKEEGYVVHNVQVDQLGTRNKTLIKVLAPEGTTYRDLVQDKGQIKSINEWSEDNGRSMLGLQTPISINSSRVAVRYTTTDKNGETKGGVDADGVIYVRPGVKDLSMGSANYAQVRIAVDGTHYLKGMAMFKDDLPKGVDLMFNTNKADTGNKLDAMKAMKDDPDNPFGSMVRQIGERDAGGRLTKVTSALNIVNEEGNWEGWKKSLSTQVLSKQSPALAKGQLDMTYERKRNDLDAILAMTNPAVRKKLLESYADGADASSIHLKAVGLPKQASHVILPINTLKPTEIYAPNYPNGTRVALIRYPHGGKFEIPELEVNNNHPDGKKYIGPQAKDAVGINHKVAERLSGADFDGDTVLVIPNNTGRIKSEPALKELKGFDPQRAYKAYDGMRTIDGGTYNATTKKVEFPKDPVTGKEKAPSSRMKGTQMGLVSNLITDMTIAGATNSEIARAVKHSMVVIDAEKHALDYKRSAKEQGIPALMKKYQDRSQGGAATLISRATARTDVDEYKARSAKDGGPVDPLTGKKVFVKTGASYVNAKGKLVVKKTQSVKLAETDDARTLISENNTKIERLYADYSNSMKAMANEARKAAVSTKTTPYSPSAKLAYAAEVRDLNSALNVALMNRPRERQAQVLANATVAAKRAANPDMEKAEVTKLKAQALEEARNRTDAKKEQIVITDQQWKAIQAGAISNNKLTQILNNADLDRVRELAQPRDRTVMTGARTARAKQMLASGYTQSDVAAQLGISLSTLKDFINEEG